MRALFSMRMPFAAVPCSIWLPTVTQDEWGNDVLSYGERADIATTCCYAPGDRRPDTSDDIEEDRPNGDEVRLTFFLPKALSADLRGALIACHPTDDPWLDGRQFAVEGVPTSYPRASTPGDYSWSVEGVARLG